MTFSESLNKPVFGHGVSSFFMFGFSHTVLAVEPMGSFYGQAHNELLQLFFEAGYMGVLIGLWFIARIIWITFRYKYDLEIIAYSASLITLISISMGQPIFHIVNMSMLACLVLSGFEARYSQLEEELC